MDRDINGDDKEWKRASEIECFKDQDGKIEWFRKGSDIWDDYDSTRENCVVNQCFGFLMRMTDSQIEQCKNFGYGQHDVERGIFQISFQHNAKWTNVVVDDILPCYQDDLRDDEGEKLEKE